MHYLSELIETPSLEDPAKNHMNIHRHFYRYSKGDFIGPALKITKSKARIINNPKRREASAGRTSPDEDN